MEDKLKKYGKSAKGNFEVIDTIGVPHPYCITPKHMLKDRMYMNGDTIREAEKTVGARCDICRKNKMNLTYDEHEQALLVACYKDIKIKEKELHAYLLKIKDMTTADKYAGFAFLDKTKGGEKHE